MQLKEIELGLTDFTRHGAPWSMMEMEKWARTFRAKKSYCTNMHNECDDERCECDIQNPEEPSDEPIIREGNREADIDPE